MEIFSKKNYSRYEYSVFSVSTCCCHQHLPQLHSEGLKGRDVWRRTLILFVVAMMAGGKNGVPWQQMEVIMVWWQEAIKRC